MTVDSKWPFEVYKPLYHAASQNVLLTAPLLKGLIEKVLRSRTVKPFHDLCVTLLSLYWAYLDSA